MTTIPILLYHGVAPDTDGPMAPWVIDPGVFRAHLAALADAGLRPLPLADLVARVHDRHEPVPAGTFVLTFDDGFADFADHAWPALCELGWPATLYVTTGFVGGTSAWLPGVAGTRPMLSWATLADLADDGTDIGAHSHTHPELDVIGRRAARAEVERSRELLSDHLGRAIDSFAYPHGYHDRPVRQAVVDAGFRSACGVTHALSSAGDDRFALARVMVRHGDDARRVVTWASGAGLTVHDPGRPALGRTVWRGCRRVRARTRRAAA